MRLGSSPDFSMDIYQLQQDAVTGGGWGAILIDAGFLAIPGLPNPGVGKATQALKRCSRGEDVGAKGVAKAGDVAVRKAYVKEVRALGDLEKQLRAEDKSTYLAP